MPSLRDLLQRQLGAPAPELELQQPNPELYDLSYAQNEATVGGEFDRMRREGLAPDENPDLAEQNRRLRRWRLQREPAFQATLRQQAETARAESAVQPEDIGGGFPGLSRSLAGGLAGVLPGHATEERPANVPTPEEGRRRSEESAMRRRASEVNLQRATQLIASPAETPDIPEEVRGGLLADIRAGRPLPEPYMRYIPEELQAQLRQGRRIGPVQTDIPGLSQLEAPTRSLRAALYAPLKLGFGTAGAALGALAGSPLPGGGALGGLYGGLKGFTAAEEALQGIDPEANAQEPVGAAFRALTGAAASLYSDRSARKAVGAAWDSMQQRGEPKHFADLWQEAYPSLTPDQAEGLGLVSELAMFKAGHLAKEGVAGARAATPPERLNAVRDIPIAAEALTPEQQFERSASKAAGKSLIAGQRQPGEQLETEQTIRGIVQGQDATAGAGAYGKPTVAIGPSGNRYEFRWKVVDASELQPSHFLQGGQMVPNPMAEEAGGVQNRNRGRTSSLMQVQGIAQNLDPQRWIGATDAEGNFTPNTSLGDGSPILAPGGGIEGGHGRSAAVIAAAQAGSPQYEAYKAYLQENANALGLDPRMVSQLQHPVLVRERVTDVDPQKFAEEVNQRTTLGMSASETATNDAKAMSAGVIDRITVAPGESVLDALRRPSNAEAVRAFLARVPAEERAALTGTRGEPTPAMAVRLRNAIVAHAYPGEAGQRLAQVLAETPDEGLKNLGRALEDAAPLVARTRAAVRPDLDISDDLARTAQKLAELSAKGEPVQNYINQPQMFGERELTPVQEQLLVALDGMKRSAKKIRAFIEAYSQAAASLGPKGQAEMAEGATKEALLDRAFRGTANVPEEQPSLFNPPAPAPAVPVPPTPQEPNVPSGRDPGEVADRGRQQMAAIEEAALQLGKRPEEVSPTYPQIKAETEAAEAEILRQGPQAPAQPTAAEEMARLRAAASQEPMQPGAQEGVGVPNPENIGRNVLEVPPVAEAPTAGQAAEEMLSARGETPAEAGQRVRAGYEAPTPRAEEVPEPMREMTPEERKQVLIKARAFGRVKLVDRDFTSRSFRRGDYGFESLQKRVRDLLAAVERDPNPSPGMLAALRDQVALAEGRIGGSALTDRGRSRVKTMLSRFTREAEIPTPPQRGLEPETAGEAAQRMMEPPLPQEAPPAAAPPPGPRVRILPQAPQTAGEAAGPMMGRIDLASPEGMKEAARRVAEGAQHLSDGALIGKYNQARAAYEEVWQNQPGDPGFEKSRRVDALQRGLRAEIERRGLAGRVEQDYGDWMAPSAPAPRNLGRIAPGTGPRAPLGTPPRGTTEVERLRSQNLPEELAPAVEQGDTSDLPPSATLRNGLTAAESDTVIMKAAEDELPVDGSPPPAATTPLAEIMKAPKRDFYFPKIPDLNFRFLMPDVVKPLWIRTSYEQLRAFNQTARILEQAKAAVGDLPAAERQRLARLLSSVEVPDASALVRVVTQPSSAARTPAEAELASAPKAFKDAFQVIRSLEAETFAQGVNAKEIDPSVEKSAYFPRMGHDEFYNDVIGVSQARFRSLEPADRGAYIQEAIKRFDKLTPEKLSKWQWSNDPNDPGKPLAQSRAEFVQGLSDYLNEVEAVRPRVERQGAPMEEVFFRNYLHRTGRGPYSLDLDNVLQNYFTMATRRNIYGPTIREWHALAQSPEWAGVPNIVRYVSNQMLQWVGAPVFPDTVLNQMGAIRGVLGGNVANRVATQWRKATSLGTLGFNPMSAVMQTLDLARFAEVVGGPLENIAKSAVPASKATMRALWDYSSPEHAEAMRNGLLNAKSITALREDFEGKVQEKVGEAAYWMMRKADAQVRVASYFTAKEMAKRPGVWTQELARLHGTPENWARMVADETAGTLVRGLSPQNQHTVLGKALWHYLYIPGKQVGSELRALFGKERETAGPGLLNRIRGDIGAPPLAYSEKTAAGALATMTSRLVTAAALAYVLGYSKNRASDIALGGTMLAPLTLLTTGSRWEQAIPMGVSPEARLVIQAARLATARGPEDRERELEELQRVALYLTPAGGILSKLGNAILAAVGSPSKKPGVALAESGGRVRPQRPAESPLAIVGRYLFRRETEVEALQREATTNMRAMTEEKRDLMAEARNLVVSGDIQGAIQMVIDWHRQHPGGDPAADVKAVVGELATPQGTSFTRQAASAAPEARARYLPEAFESPEAKGLAGAAAATKKRSLRTLILERLQTQEAGR